MPFRRTTLHSQGVAPHSRMDPCFTWVKPAGWATVCLAVAKEDYGLAYGSTSRWLSPYSS